MKNTPPKRSYENLGIDEDIESISDIAAEKIGVTYATEAYKDCHTLQDFQDKFREIQSRSFNFM